MELRLLTKLKTVLPRVNLAVLLILIVIVITIVRIKQDDYKTSYDLSTKSITGTITNIDYKNDYTVLSVKNKETVLVTTNDSEYYQLGTKIRVTGSIKKPNRTAVFHVFMYDQYLKGKHIYWMMKASKIELLSSKQSWYYNLQEQFINHISKYQSKGYLYAFILGDSGKMDDEVKGQFQTLGISHLFAISGMHVGILSMLLTKLLSKFFPSRVVSIFLTIFFIYYIFLTGATPSVIRSVFITIIFLWTKRYQRINMILFLASLLLLYNPFYLYQLGFLFSFTISFFLLKFQYLTQNHGRIKSLWSTSVIAFLSSFPILIANFFEVNLLTVFYNLLYVPFVSYLLFPLALLTFCLPILDSILLVVIDVFEFLLSITTKVTWIVTFCHVPNWFLCIYYIIIYQLLLKWQARKYRYIVILLMLIFIHQQIPYTKDSQITMLDVGQGDSILIQLKRGGGTILIDTGGIPSFTGEQNYFLVSQRTIPYMKSQGIKKLDALILTHGDFDHMGEAAYLVNHFKVDNVIFNPGQYNKLETEFIRVLEHKNIKYDKGIEKLNVGRYKLRFLNTKIYNNENDNSSVVYLDHARYKFLFMGDAGIVKENDILNKYDIEDIDFLKVGHHGSDTSSGQSFINHINPKHSLISVGKDNRYGHPVNSILDNLSRSTIYRTDMDGSIEINLNRNGYKIKTMNK